MPGRPIPNVAFRKKAVPIVLKDAKGVPINLEIKRIKETKVTL